jgi:streptogramin lyase
LEELEDRRTPSQAVEFALPTPGAAPSGIAAGPDGNLWFAETGIDRIGRIRPDGVVNEFGLTPGSAPADVVAGPDGNVWFTERGGDRIGRISTGPISVTEFSVGITAGSAPNNITVGPDGNLWLTESAGNRIGRITTAGMVTEFTVPTPGSVPLGIAAGPDGALWFTELMGDKIGRITTAGVVTGEFSLATGSAPNSITVGPDGNLWFTEVGRDKIGEMSTAGVLGGEFSIFHGSLPQGIVAGPGHRLFFAESGRDELGRLTLTPDLSPRFGNFETGGITPDSSPTDVAIGPDNALWFTESTGNRIGRLRPDITYTAVGADAGGGPQVKVFDDSGKLFASFFAFDPSFRGGVRVAVGDVNGDGIADIIVAAGPSGGPHVKVIDGDRLTVPGNILPNGEISDNALDANFFAYDASFRGGVYVAAGDVDGDGSAEVITGVDAGGGPHVKVFKTGNPFLTVDSFFAFNPAFTGGVRVAAGDVNGDGKDDIIASAGPGGGPHVVVVDATKANQIQANGQITSAALLQSFFAYNSAFTGGVYVAAGDVTGDGRPDIITGAGALGGPHVKAFDGTNGTLVRSFFAFDSSNRDGVRVAAGDINGDGVADISVALGPPSGPTVAVFDGVTLSKITQYTPFDPGFLGGVQVGGGRSDSATPFGVIDPIGVLMKQGTRNLYVFRSPSNPNNTVMVLTASDFAGTGATGFVPPVFDPNRSFSFNISNRDLTTATNDIRYLADFSHPDANFVQDLILLRLDGEGVNVAVRGNTGQNLHVAGVGGTNALFRAGVADNPFFMDLTGINQFLDGGPFPRPVGTATNFYGPNANTMAIVLELPSSVLQGPTSDLIGVWGGSSSDVGNQEDRVGRPLINTLLIPQIPRGPNHPPNGTDRRFDFLRSNPNQDVAGFKAAMVSILTSFYGRTASDANAIANLLLPDIQVFQLGNPNGFGTFVGPGGEFLGNGRRLTDDVTDFLLNVITNGVVTTDNVGDDNGLRITDGSVDPVSGQTRAVAFPYIGPPNASPTGAPGGIVPDFGPA